MGFLIEMLRRLGCVDDVITSVVVPVQAHPNPKSNLEELEAILSISKEENGYEFIFSKKKVDKANKKLIFELCKSTDLSPMYVIFSSWRNHSVMVVEKMVDGKKMVGFVTFSFRTLDYIKNLYSNPCISNRINMNTMTYDETAEFIEIDTIVTSGKGVGSIIIKSFNEKQHIYLSSLINVNTYKFYMNKSFRPFYFDDGNTIYELPHKKCGNFYYTTEFVYTKIGNGKDDTECAGNITLDKSPEKAIESCVAIDAIQQQNIVRSWHGTYLIPLILLIKPIPAASSPGGANKTKVLFKSYYYKVRTDRYGKFILTKNGRVPINKVIKEAAKKKRKNV